MDSLSERIDKGARAAQLGLVTNAFLVVVKIVAGILGTSSALIADGVESSADIFSSLIVWRGIKISGRSADEEYHFGYSKAESVAGAVVAIMLLGASLGVIILAIREILTPHHLPAPFTLLVLLAVIVIKEVLFKKVSAVGEDVESSAVQSDAWHHRADALSSGAAFIGILLAVWNGPGWETADDYAALVSAVIIAYNGYSMLRPALNDLMDKAPEKEVLDAVLKAAWEVEGVQCVEKLMARKAGLGYFVALHIQADPALSLRDAHIIGGKVKTAIRRSVPTVLGALIHMEPFEGG